ncbi:hypothetical protein ACLEEK_13955 [Lonsdalea quercina]|uniref:hypothetical protein n=1 Tax=Lonsdalea quercina TaxID=71657 RepID=UPI003974EEBF
MCNATAFALAPGGGVVYRQLSAVRQHHLFQFTGPAVAEGASSFSSSDQSRVRVTL